MFSVIFDMDGTLLDTQRICIPAWEYAGQMQGFSGLGKYIENVCGMNELGWKGYLKENFPQMDIESFTFDARDYIKKNGVVKYKKGAEELLTYLKQNNIKMGLASGSSRASIEHHFSIVGGLENFDVVVAGMEVEKGKPAPDIFLKVAEQLGEKPENCYVFEDSNNGVKAGYSAGMKCIGIADIAPFTIETKKLLTAELNSLDEAINIFETL